MLATGRKNSLPIGTDPDNPIKFQYLDLLHILALNMQKAEVWVK
jgi:hypothetical protein